MRDRLLDRIRVVGRDARKAEVVVGRVDQHDRQAALREAADSARGRRAACAYWPPEKIIPETWCSSSISTYSASEIPAVVRVQRTGVNPRLASASATTSANAGKIGFCSSGSTSPTSRARAPRSCGRTLVAEDVERRQHELPASPSPTPGR